MSYMCDKFLLLEMLNKNEGILLYQLKPKNIVFKFDSFNKRTEPELELFTNSSDASFSTLIAQIKLALLLNLMRINGQCFWWGQLLIFQAQTEVDRVSLPVAQSLYVFFSLPQTHTLLEREVATKIRWGPTLIYEAVNKKS